MSHHGHHLSDDNGTVKRVLNFSKSVFKDTCRRLIQHEVTETPVIIVKKNSGRNLFTSKLGTDGLLESLNFNTLNILKQHSLLVIETDVDSLLSEDLFSVFVRGLSDDEAIKLSVSLRVLSLNFRSTYSLKPSAAPFSKVKLTLIFSFLLVVSLL